jgi:hypothetical protein
MEELLELQYFVDRIAFLLQKWIQHPEKPLLHPKNEVSTIEIFDSLNS